MGLSQFPGSLWPPGLFTLNTVSFIMPNEFSSTFWLSGTRKCTTMYFSCFSLGFSHFGQNLFVGYFEEGIRVEGRALSI